MAHEPPDVADAPLTGVAPPREVMRHPQVALSHLEPAWPESQITYSKMLAAIDGPVRGEVYLKELIKAYFGCELTWVQSLSSVLI